MSSVLTRRNFLTRTWKVGVGLIGVAGVWSMWDLLQPLATGGFGGVIRSISPAAVSEGAVVEIAAARADLSRLPGGELVALSWKCPHLGCKVSWCDTAEEFQCPCHGSKFNIAGERLAGPTPRGLDIYPYDIGSDQLVYIDTGSKITGPPPGTFTQPTPPGGTICAKDGA